MYRTSDQIALEFIAEGRLQGIAERGIVICIATGLVESNLKVLANPAVPESLSLPNDGLGFDGMSVGPLQQQVRKGENGAWWWADARTCMDPTLSAGLFYERLKGTRYQDATTNHAAGVIAQSVQKSAFPDRYESRMNEAAGIYSRLADSRPAESSGGSGNGPLSFGITKTMYGFRADTPDNATGNSNGPRSATNYAVIHTQEGASTAVQLTNYCNSHDVSYNLVIDDKDTIELVPVGEGPWAAVDANNIGIHICFAGSFANWSRGKWLETDASDGLNEDAMLTRGAVAVAAACRRWGIPATWVTPGAGWPASPKGVAGHVDFGQRGGGHTDPGNGFPRDEFMRRVNLLLANPEGDFMADDKLYQSFYVDENGVRSTFRAPLPDYIRLIDRKVEEMQVQSGKDREQIDYLTRLVEALALKAGVK